MESDFLKAADRGRSRFQDYALSLLFIVIGLLGSIVILSSSIVLYRIAFRLPLEGFSSSALSCHGRLFLAIVVYLVFSSIIFLTTLIIHKRSPQTLINTGPKIRIQRLLFGFTAWFLIRAGSSGVLAFIYPKTYSLTSFSILKIFTLILGFIFCFFASFSGAVLVAYLLQGLNQIVRDSFLSIVYFILLIAAFFVFLSNNFQVIFFVLVTLSFLLFTIILLQEEGIELNVGWLMANAYYANFCVSSRIEGGNLLLAECRSLFVAGVVPEILGFLISIAQLGIFYCIFLVDRGRSQTGAN